MHTTGPIIMMTCSVCGSVQAAQTLIRAMQMPGDTFGVRDHIFAPMLIHTGDGGHMVAHPAIPLDQMESGG